MAHQHQHQPNPLCGTFTRPADQRTGGELCQSTCYCGDTISQIRAPHTPPTPWLGDVEVQQAYAENVMRNALRTVAL